MNAPNPGVDDRAPSVAARIAAVLAGYLAYIALLLTLPGREAAQARPLPDAASGAAERSLIGAGRTLWRQRQCQVCHSLYGLGGHLGPDLTNVVRRLPPEGIRTTIRWGRAVMPAFEMDEAELTAITAFLADVDRTGTYPPGRLLDPVFGEAP